MNPVGIELRGAETGEQPQPGRFGGGQHRGELGEDLRKTVSIPDRIGPVHRRRNDHWALRTGLDELGQDLQEGVEDGLNALADDGILLRVDDEVGHTRKDECIRIFLDLENNLSLNLRA